VPSVSLASDSATISSLPASPSPSPSPDPEAVRKAAGTAYLAAAKIANDARKKVDANYPTNLTLKQARSYYAALAKIEGAFLIAIRKIEVPADTAADMHTLIVREAASQALLLELAKASSIGDLNAAAADLRRAGRNATAAANLVRSDLGLPPVKF
jgi:hypothetical protein